MLHEQLWQVLSFTGEVSTTVNLERREHADVRLLITTHADNNHLFDGKATNKDAFEKIAEQFTKASVFSVKRRRGACKRMGLVTNGTLSSQTEIPRTPNRNFPKFFCKWKTPHIFWFGRQISFCARFNDRWRVHSMSKSLLYESEQYSRVVKIYYKKINYAARSYPKITRLLVVHSFFYWKSNYRKPQ